MNHTQLTMPSLPCRRRLLDQADDCASLIQEILNLAVVVVVVSLLFVFTRGYKKQAWSKREASVCSLAGGTFPDAGRPRREAGTESQWLTEWMDLLNSKRKRSKEVWNDTWGVKCYPHCFSNHLTSSRFARLLSNLSQFTNTTHVPTVTVPTRGSTSTPHSFPSHTNTLAIATEWRQTDSSWHEWHHVLTWCRLGQVYHKWIWLIRFHV